MKVKTRWKTAALLLVMAVCAGVTEETPSFAQNSNPAAGQERDQRYLIYVKGIT